MKTALGDTVSIRNWLLSPSEDAAMCNNSAVLWCQRHNSNTNHRLEYLLVGVSGLPVPLAAHLLWTQFIIYDSVINSDHIKQTSSRNLRTRTLTRRRSSLPLFLITVPQCILAVFLSLCVNPFTQPPM